MQLITFLSAAAATVATVSADRNGAPTLNKACDTSKPMARVINRCDYPVYLWSVLKNVGCPADQMVTLKKGEIYSENLARATDPTHWSPEKPEDETGVSIKISKYNQCKGGDITQLEYFLDDRTKIEKAFQMNYLDVSYVDCLGGDCPSRKEGFYLQVGTSKVRAEKATDNNSWCPILSCNDPISCAKIAYIFPDDIQTKTCDMESSMDLYLCGSQVPSEDGSEPSSSPAPAPSSQKPDTSSPKPSTTKASSTADNYGVKAAAVTPAAQIDDAAKTPKVKTKVVYVTAYEYVNAKRSEHVHKHARRNQPFHA